MNKCVICDKEIPKNRKVCSVKCQGKLTSKRQIGKNNPSYKSGNFIRHTIVCDFCGGKATSRTTTTKNHFCSKECKDNYARTQVGELNYNWKDNTSRSAIGMIARRYLGNECIICGWNETINDSHHLIEVKGGGTNKLDNIVIVCPNHHRFIHEGKTNIKKLKELWKEKYSDKDLPGGYIDKC